MIFKDLVQSLNHRLLVISLAIMLLSLALPIALLQVYDRILPNQGVGTAWVLALGVLIAMLAEAGLRYGRSWLLNREGMKYEAWSTVEAMRHLLTTPSPVLRAIGRHGIDDRLAALKQYQDYYSGQAMLALYDAPFILLFLFLIGYVGGAVVIIPIITLCLAFIVVYRLGDKAHDFSVARDESLALRAPLMSSVFESIVHLKAAGIDGAANRAFDHRHRNLASEQAGLDEYMMHIQMVTQFFSQVTTVLVVILSAHLVISGQMSSGALAACTLLAGRAMAPVGALFSFWGQIQRSDTMRQKAQSLLAMSEGESVNTTSVPGPVGIEVSNLRLPGVSASIGFKVTPGQRCMLPETSWQRWDGFFNALAGRETQVTGDWQFQSRSGDSETDQVHVALVSDLTTIFQGTLLENLTMFSAERETDAMAWSRRLGLHDRVTRLPNGYETMLSEHYGSGVDRGTEQLIGIIRGLAGQPQVLLLNHADRGLDLRTQQLLADALIEEAEKTTILMASNCHALKSAFESVELTGVKA